MPTASGRSPPPAPPRSRWRRSRASRARSRWTRSPARRRSPATARRLGAVVTAFDVRAAVKEQVQSLGAKFLELEGAADAEGAGGYARELTAEEQQAQRDALAAQIARSDVVITTALVPGRPAPRL